MGKGIDGSRRKKTRDGIGGKMKTKKGKGKSSPPKFSWKKKKKKKRFFSSFW